MLYVLTIFVSLLLTICIQRWIHCVPKAVLPAVVELVAESFSAREVSSVVFCHLVVVHIEKYIAKELQAKKKKQHDYFVTVGVSKWNPWHDNIFLVHLWQNITLCFYANHDVKNFQSVKLIGA